MNLPKQIPISARIIASMVAIVLAIIIFKLTDENKLNIKYYECGKQVSKLNKVIVCN